LISTGSLRCNRFTDNAFADAETAALRFGVWPVWKRIRGRGAVVQQGYKDTEIDDGADKLRGLVHDGLQVEWR
jgi:hypothetical protein